MLQTIAWTGSAARLIDQTKLPTEVVYVDITDEKQMWDAIKRLVVRGAPAIGVAAAFGVYLGVRDFPEIDSKAFLTRVDEVCAYLATSRPTAVNLFWALDRMKAHARNMWGANPQRMPDTQVIPDIKDELLYEAKTMLAEDTAVCKAIGEHGMALIRQICGERKEYGVLTHCNAGSLCAVTYGTALAPIYYGAEQGVKFHVFADETRPLLQGARITAFELQASGIPVTVICDNMAATVMSQGKVCAVIVGTDRVAANGDVANKIGTLGVAILARHYDIPFFVAAPTSSIDPAIATGKQIPIEERDPREISHGLGRQTVADGTAIYNPAFDVTPAELVTALITEKGVLRPPYGEAIRKVLP
jgi:methylthioribose-1-phosphate isomerase